MSQSLSAEERAKLRFVHGEVGGFTREDKEYRWCKGCQSTSIPCPMIRLLDALERAEREIQRFQVTLAWSCNELRVYGPSVTEWFSTTFPSMIEQEKWERKQLDAGRALVEGVSHE